MAEKVTLEQIYTELGELKKVMSALLKDEEAIMKEELALAKGEKEEIDLLKKIHGKDINRKYSDIMSWKGAIWDTCPDKIETQESAKLIDYKCKKTGKTCRFLDCYRNKEK
jgi:hypothetical protein